MGLLVDRQRDTIENIAFASPLAGSKIANGATFRKQLVCMQKMSYSGLWSVSISVVISGGSRISSRRGRQLPRGGRQHTILPNFPKNCMKLKEFGPPGGGARPKFYYVDPPLVITEYDLSSHSFTESENLFSYLTWHLF